MPKGTNRVLADHISDLLYVPTKTGVKNLKAEGIVTGFYHTGDAMYNAAFLCGEVTDRKSENLKKLQIQAKQFYLATVHRSENTDQPKRLRSILDALLFLNEKIPVVLPSCIPEQQKFLTKLNLRDNAEKLYLTQPLSYFHNVPCITFCD